VNILIVTDAAYDITRLAAQRSVGRARATLEGSVAGTVESRQTGVVARERS
jgi:hypothetical protein